MLPTVLKKLTKKGRIAKIRTIHNTGAYNKGDTDMETKLAINGGEPVVKGSLG